MGKSKEVLEWDKFCPACGEDGDLYEYWPHDSGEPSPAEAYCSRCDWNFIETAQHNPLLRDVKKYRLQRISGLKKELKRLEKWQP